MIDGLIDDVCLCLPSPQDLLVVGSDSGSISLIEYIDSSDETPQPHLRGIAQLHVGHSGCRR